MNMEAKLDQIIELLTRIESKLDAKPHTPAAALETIKPAKPTPGQLKFKRMIELAASMDRTHLFSHIRKNAAEYDAERKLDPNWRLSFTPQFTPKIDEKIQKTGAQFYKDIKAWNETISGLSKRKPNKSSSAPLAVLTLVPEHKAS
jgi:hypothetical protein